MKWWSKESEAGSAGSTPRRSSSLFGSLKASLSGGWNADFASDPSSWEQLFEKQFEALDDALAKEHSLRSVREVFEKLRLMCQLLMMEVNSQPEAVIGPILDKFFSFGILEEVERWAERAPPLLVPTCQVEFVRLYDDVLNGSHSDNHCLLVHKPILLPLLQMLEWFGQDSREKPSSDISRHFVVLLNQISSKMAEDATLLDFFFNFRSDEAAERQFIVFHLLTRYLYESSDTGQLARDALLLILSVTKESEDVADYVAFRSNFCPVLATGLSGCFSELSSHVCSALNSGLGWHRISAEDVAALPSLTLFHDALVFVDAVMATAHPLVGAQIVAFFQSGFLRSVVLTAFAQSGVDEVVSVTAYFHLCLRTVTQPALLQALVRLLLLEPINDASLLDLVLRRMVDMKSERLCQVTLSLVSTVVNLRCEDVMWATLFKYLQAPLPRGPRHPVYDATASLAAAERFLDYAPDCVRSVPQLFSPESFSSFRAEAREAIAAANVACAKWRWNYDGLHPHVGGSTGSSRTFTRLSSARSSMASNGLNRYFSSRSAHVTAESLSLAVLKTLNELGTAGEDDDDDFYREDELEEPTDFDDEMPSTTSQYDLMTQSTTDYFQFTYDDVSSSEEEKETPKTPEPRKKPSTTAPGVTVAPKYAPAEGWKSVETLDDFLKALDKIPLDPKRDPVKKGDENMARIDAKLQYLRELKEEEERSRTEEEVEVVPPLLVEEEAPIGDGIQMECDERHERPVLVSCVFSLLENLLYNSFEVNLQLMAVLKALVAFPNPILVSYFLNPEDPTSKTDVKSLFQILSNLGVLVNSYASSIEGFSTALERGVRIFKTREEKIEKARHQPLTRTGGAQNGKGPEELSRFRMFGNSRRRPEFRHARITQTAETRDSAARTKQIVSAAIFLSQVCQEMAAFALQHAVTVKLPAKCSQQSKH